VLEDSSPATDGTAGLGAGVARRTGSAVTLTASELTRVVMRGVVADTGLPTPALHTTITASDRIHALTAHACAQRPR
jgi:hypothetical protein